MPSHNKCIAITNQPNPTGPYYTTLATCGTDYPQRWVVRTDMNNALYWVNNPAHFVSEPQIDILIRNSQVAATKKERSCKADVACWDIRLITRVSQLTLTRISRSLSSAEGRPSGLQRKRTNGLRLSLVRDWDLELCHYSISELDFLSHPHDSEIIIRRLLHRFSHL